jgi:acyl-CoA thioester hydrolase
MNEKQKSFEIKIRVPFFDLDPMQIVWHGNYLNYFEMARAALFEHNGVDLYSYYDRHIFSPCATAMKSFARRHLSMRM